MRSMPACRSRVKALGEAGFLKAVVGAEHGGLHSRLDVRTLCLAREILAARDGLADFAFAMQGLGTGAISLFGSAALKQRYLPRCATAKRLRHSRCPSPRQAPTWPRSLRPQSRTAHPTCASAGSRPWISNGGIADHYVVFVRTGEAPGAKGTLRVPGRCGYAWAERGRAHRGHRAASPCHVELRCSARTACEPSRARRARDSR